MNEASAKASKDDEADGVHRLRDIVVEEVSLVDRAANQRRFLVVKRSAEMADENTATADTKPDSPKAIAKAKKKPASDEAVDEEKAKKKPTDEPRDDSTDAEKAARPHEDDEEEDDAEKAQRTGSEDEDDEEADDEDRAKRRKQALALSPAVKESVLRTLTKSLEGLMVVAKRVKDAKETADATMPADLGRDVARIAETLLAVGGAAADANSPTGVAKAGARMAKDRLDRFQKALLALSDILKELTQAKEPPAAPSAGSAETGVTKRAPAPREPAAIPGIADLVSGIGELTRVVKRQEEELTRMRQARGVSNAIPVEGGRRAEAQDVSWPLDMNRPISRDKVRKEVSFFEE